MGEVGGLPRLMLVTDRHRIPGRDLVDLVARSILGGVGFVQVREKDLTESSLLELLESIHQSVPRSTRIAINGRERLARKLGVGLHLPAWQSSPARKGLPLLGRSVHSAREAEMAVEEGMDYIILGAIFPTVSKPGNPGRGLDFLREICTLVSPMPVYAIGGIQISRVPGVLRAGAHGLAVCGAILATSDPDRAARGFSLALEVASHHEGIGIG